MKIYRVGGSVRDALLGQPIKDIDYVVVGASPEQMIAAGFSPVGKDFPVFIHPETHAEYALARTERKSAPGYHGFVFHCAPDVTIEQDLQRRDLTINAMAIAEDDRNHHIIDPFDGQRDLAQRVFRHVSEAFSEDPVRILRVARFAARFDNFTIAPETMQLMRAMVESGEVDALVPERVWQEMARGLMEHKPSRMFEVLLDTGAMEKIMPEVGEIRLLTTITTDDIRMEQVVDQAAQLGFALVVRCAAMLTAVSGNAAETTVLHSSLITKFCARLKVPTEVRDITQLVLRERTHIENALSLQPEAILQLFERCDAFRRPNRLTQVMQAVLCIHYAQCQFPQQAFLERVFAAAQAIPSSDIVQATMLRFPNQPQEIAAAISAARLLAIKRAIKTESE